jgi:hypothetical protein
MACEQLAALRPIADLDTSACVERAVTGATFGLMIPIGW